MRKYLGLPVEITPIKRKVQCNKDIGLPTVRYYWKSGDAENILHVKAQSEVSLTSIESKQGWTFEHLDEFSAAPKSLVFHRTIKPNCKTFDVAKANFKCSVKKMFGSDFIKPLDGCLASVYLFNGGKPSFLPGARL